MDYILSEEVNMICSSTPDQISINSITAKTIAAETDKDENLSKIKIDLMNWNSADLDYTPQVFFSKVDGLSSQKRSDFKFFEELHETHIGIVKCNSWLDDIVLEQESTVRSNASYGLCRYQENSIESFLTLMGRTS